MKKNLCLLIILLLIQNCGPLISGIGVVAVGSASKEKGIGTAFNDNVIYVNILNSLYKWDENISKDINLNVDEGSVLITGKLKNSDTKIKLTKIIWGVRGVKEVVNEAQISDVSDIKNIARDLASVGEIRARMLANPNINSLNFSVDVVNDIAYVSGIASKKEELDIVENIVKSARFVKEIYNYIKINTDNR